MATVQKYVNTASTAGGDGTTNNTSGATRAYASLSEWEANTETGVATDEFIVDCCGTAADTTAVVVDFATNITTGSITIRGNRSDAAGFYDGTAVISSSHYRLAPASGSDALVLAEANGTFIADGIQIEWGGSFRVGIDPGQGGNTRIFEARNNRIRAIDASAYSGIGSGNVVYAFGPGMVLENNLIVGAAVTGIELRAATHFSNVVTVRHNTIYGANGGSTSGILLAGSPGSGSINITIKGNAIAGSSAGNDINDSTTGATITYADNALEEAEGTAGEIALGAAADAWTSPGTTAAADFTVKNTASALYNAVNPTLVTTDITGFTRDGTNHDVGAFELQAGGGVASNPTGVQGSGQAGTTSVQAGAAVNLSGASSSAAVGTLSVSTGASAEAALSGAPATGSAGTISPEAGAQTQVTGVQAASNAGAITATGDSPNASANLGGVAATSSAGDVAVQAGASTNVTGVAATGQAGDAVGTSATLAEVTGVQAAAAAGAPTVTADATVSVSGASGSAAVGTLSALDPDASVTISGVASTLSAGAILIGDVLYPARLTKGVRKATSLTKGVRKVGSMTKGTFPS